MTVVPSAWKSRSRLAEPRNATAISVPIVLSSPTPPPSSLITLRERIQAGERSEIGMPSVQEVYDQSGVSLQPEVAIFRRWLTWSRWRKKKRNCERAWDWREARKVHYADGRIFRKSVIGISIWREYSVKCDDGHNYSVIICTHIYLWIPYLRVGINML